MERPREILGVSELLRSKEAELFFVRPKIYFILLLICVCVSRERDSSNSFLKIHSIILIKS